MNAGATWSTNTPNGQGCSLLFNGSNGFVAIPYISTTNTSLTYSVWFNSSIAASSSILSLRYTLLRAGSSEIDWWPNASTQQVAIAKNISLNAWHQIVVDQNGTAYAIYLDGGLLGSGTSVAINNANGSNYIGEDAYTNAIFKGLIDNVRTFSRSLTAKEVRQIYAEEAPWHGLVVASIK
jgi:hypothetical protein